MKEHLKLIILNIKRIFSLKNYSFISYISFDFLTDWVTLVQTICLESLYEHGIVQLNRFICFFLCSQHTVVQVIFQLFFFVPSIFIIYLNKWREKIMVFLIVKFFPIYFIYYAHMGGNSVIMKITK